MEAKLLLAFTAGLLSFATPCVLPLVPGYLSAVSGTRPGASGRQVVVASLPFVAGFTTVFVALGVAAAATGGALGGDRRLVMQIAGILVVALGFAFMGLLPFPFLDRLAAPGLLEGAQRSGSSALLGGAFAVCAAPCVGPVLVTILALAGDEGRLAQGTALLTVYALGLALPFLLVGLGAARTMSTFRWVRDRYEVVRIVSGAVLGGVGLLLFFDRWWWLNVAFNRVFEALGIGV